MAREITCTVTLFANKNGARVSHTKSKVSDMTGDDMIQSTQLIGTTAEALTFDEISGAPQSLLIENLDSTNYVEIDSASAMDKFPQKLLAGDAVLLKPQTGTIYAKANTAAVRIAKCAVEL